jgi:hypothetical protein
MQPNEQKQPNEKFEPTVVVKTYRVILGLCPIINKFPKIYKHAIGQELLDNLLAILKKVFTANAMPRPLRESPLIEAISACETAKILMRLCSELGIMINTQYFQYSANIAEIGKMLGGWIAFVRNGKNERK